MTTGIGGVRSTPALSQSRNATIPLEELAPWVLRYASQYGVNPEIMAAIVEQESSYINHTVHRDGTGHGLIGLDDKGLLPDFERWSGLQIGRGRRAVTIPPEKQIEFLAKTLGAFSERFQDEWEAVRAWHGGAGGRNKPWANDYEQRIRGRIPNVAYALIPTHGAAAPSPVLIATAPSQFETSVRPAVSLDPKPASQPIPQRLDYEVG